MNFRVLCGILIPVLTGALGMNSLASRAHAEDAPQNQPPVQPPATTPNADPHNGNPDNGRPDNNGQGGTPDNGPNGRDPGMPPPGWGQPQGDGPQGKNAQFRGRPDGHMGQGMGGPGGGQYQGFGPQFPPGGGGYRGGDNAANRRNQSEVRLRVLMGIMGFQDTNLQTAIIQHIKDEEKAMTPVRAASRALMDTMRDPHASPERLTALLNNLHVALEADKLRRKEAQLILDNKIDYSHSPRLEAMLTLLGVLDDSPTSLAVRNSTLDIGNSNLRQNLNGQIVIRIAPPQPNTTLPATAPQTAVPKVEPVKEPAKDIATPDKTAPIVNPAPAENK